MNATISKHQRKIGLYLDNFEITYTANSTNGDRICTFMSVCNGYELAETHNALLLKTQSHAQDAGYTLV